MKFKTIGFSHSNTHPESFPESVCLDSLDVLLNVWIAFNIENIC